MYGKLMSISDRLMLDYFDALSAGEWSDLQPERARLAGEGGDPHAFKHALARRVVERFHGAQAAAEAAAEHFRRTVQEREAPADLPETVLELGEGGVLGLLEILERLGITPLAQRGAAAGRAGSGGDRRSARRRSRAAAVARRLPDQGRETPFCEGSTALSARIRPAARLGPAGPALVERSTGALPLTRVGASRRFRPPRDQKQPARFRLRVAGSSEGLGTGPQGLRSVFEN